MESNGDIAKVLREIAAFLQMEGVGFKPRAYEKAAQSVEASEASVAALFRQGGVQQVATLPGVGRSIAEKIGELIETGRVTYLEEMRARRPVELMEMIAIEGVGPKKVGALYDALGVRTLKELERAAKEGRIRNVPGFGEKSEREILRGLEFLSVRRGRFPLGEVLPLVTEIEERLKHVPGVGSVTVAGSIRRRKDTIGDVDLLAVSQEPRAVMDSFVAMPEVDHVYGKGNTKSSLRLSNGLDVDLRVVPEKSYGAALNYFTGSKQHNLRLRLIAQEKGLKLNEYGLFDLTRGERLVAGPTEEGIYEALGLVFIPPELREDRGEIEAALEGRLPSLIPYGALRGDLQVHTVWSDGKHSVEEMARAAQQQGLDYIAITDHTMGLAMTGLNEDGLTRQLEEIQRVNHVLHRIRVLSGAEVNIQKDGSLDVSDRWISRLDVVGAAVHSHFNLSRREMTERICCAIQNPHVDILFHPTGRIVNKREPYPLDMEEVLRVARQTGTLVEVDAIPDRLDLSDVHVRAAVAAGVPLVIDSDAHSLRHLGLRDLGIAQARRGWARAQDVANTRPLEEFLSFLKG